MRVRSGACPWARRANPNASCLPSVHSTQLIWRKTGSRHPGKPHSARQGARPQYRDGAPARPHDGVSTQDARHFDTHTTEPPGGTRAEIERARHSPHLCAAPAPGSTRSRKVAGPRLLHKVSVSLSPLSRVAGRRVELIWPTRWVRRAGASDPHAGHTQRAAVLMGGHTAFSTNRHEAQPRRTSDAAEAGSVDAAHGRPVTVRQGSGHMCVCRKVRAEPEPQPARERTGSRRVQMERSPRRWMARGERQKLQQGLCYEPLAATRLQLEAHLSRQKPVRKKGCCAESDTLEASRSVTLTCGAT